MRSLTFRYVLAVSLIAAMSAATLGISLLTTRTSGEDAELINIAGRQRMLSQRIARLALESVIIETNQPSRRAITRQLESTINLFETANTSLARGADGRPAVALVYTQDGLNLDAKSRAFSILARNSLTEQAGAGQLRELSARADDLLPDLDLATLAYEAWARGRIDTLHRLQWSVFLATLALLGLVTILIFRPAIRATDRALKLARDAASKAVKADAAKSEFLAQMSHEIRTPLNGVLGMATALGQTEVAPPQQHMINTMMASGDLLLAIINDVLDLAKIEAGEIELEETGLSLVQLLDWTASAFKPACDAKAISFQTSIEPAAQGWYRGDPTRIRQILSNLVSNAIKFTETGQVSVTVSLTKIDADERHHLLVAVEDSGIGISPDRIAAIFDPFIQADNSTTRAYGGTGLGLPICGRLAEHMGGSIQVESRPGEGSTFTASLCLLPAEAPVIAPAPAPETRVPPSRTLRFLVVDDVATNRLVLASLLAPFGVSTTDAASGAEAIEISSREPFDAILMDVQMPVMDGIEATRLIRTAERLAGHTRTPIIAVTANVMREQIASYLAAGMDTHLAKPLKQEQLSTLVNSMRELHA